MVMPTPKLALDEAAWADAANAVIAAMLRKIVIISFLPDGNRRNDFHCFLNGQVRHNQRAGVKAGRPIDVTSRPSL
jgi:hypothetical protein